MTARAQTGVDYMIILSIALLLAVGIVWFVFDLDIISLEDRATSSVTSPKLLNYPVGIESHVLNQSCLQLSVVNNELYDINITSIALDNDTLELTQPVVLSNLEREQITACGYEYVDSSYDHKVIIEYTELETYNNLAIDDPAYSVNGYIG